MFGIELLDIRFKRINYNESVRPKIYDRMISERRQIAERFLSEGNGEAARIRGNRVRDLNKIQSEAYRQVEEIRGLIADGTITGGMIPKVETCIYALEQGVQGVVIIEATIGPNGNVTDAKVLDVAMEPVKGTPMPLQTGASGAGTLRIEVTTDAASISTGSRKRGPPWTTRCAWPAKWTPLICWSPMSSCHA